MDKSDVCIQFTGGKDSTLLAALMAQEFERVHLLSFYHGLVVDMDKIPTNVEKLRKLYGEDRFRHVVISNEGLLRELYAGRWFRDLKKYGTYAANNVCGPCRLSMATHSIVHCLQNGVSFVRDGANRTGFDLSQQTWALDAIRAFYAEYGIDYECPLYDASRNDIDLLKLGLAAEEPVLFYRSQPLCKGGGEVHNIYLRCYYLPAHGREARIRRDQEWMVDKLDVCREYISRHCHGC